MPFLENLAFVFSKDSRSDNKKRFRNFCIELYPDTTSYDIQTVLDNIKNRFIYYSFILHDSDVDEDGNLKKPHYHVVALQKDGSTISAISKCLGIPINFIVACSSVRSAIRYLIHKDDPDKFQYSPLNIESNYPLLLNCFDYYKPSESEQFIILLDYLKQRTTLYSLCKFASDNNMWSCLRRNFSILKCFFPSDNSDFYNI